MFPILNTLLNLFIQIIIAIYLFGYFCLSSSFSVLTILLFGVIFVKILKLEIKPGQKMKIFSFHTLTVLFLSFGKVQPIDVLETLGIVFLSQYIIICIDVFSEKL